MGLLDSVLGAVMGGQQGGNSQLINIAMSMLGNDGQSGGLGGLMAKFQEAGLGDQISSWVGKGENMPINADQLSQVLGSGAIGDIASKLGVDPSAAAGQLSEMLPGLIDKLTPNGEAPAGGLGNAGDLMGMLGGLLAKR
jgi:uncharacterized protein YidB (DUF937 family)